MNDTLMSTIRDGILTALLAIIAVAIPAITAPLIAYLRKRFTAQQLADAIRIGRTAVLAAEQVAARSGFDGRGKFLDALAQARRLAAAQGFDLTDAQWGAIIEAAVLRLRQTEVALTLPEYLPGEVLTTEREEMPGLPVSPPTGSPLPRTVSNVPVFPPPGAERDREGRPR